ncbi:MAG: ATPase, T2SS/T4P/T4SS family [Firmicutes bacterium]|nr:ATPase, T2SS/T4P/T4SS family [Bacillota bacterium]
MKTDNKDCSSECDERSYESRMIRKIRARFTSEVSLDDRRAMEIIVEEIFGDKESGIFDDAALDRIIKKLFCKTRRRLGILQPLLEDKQVTEIMVNGPEHIFAEKDGRIQRWPLSFDSADELTEIIRNIAGDVHREISEMNPIVDARLADGSRVNSVYSNVAINGPILTIRKFSDSYMTMKDLTGNGTLTSEAALLLENLVQCGYNIFVSGGTSSGKTTLLNALAEAIPRDERVIVIEDSMELKLSAIENIVHMECRNAGSSGRGSVTMSRLIKSSLRMRPDRIIVGEVRGEEVADMLQAMNTGHSGSMSTGHGNSVEGMLRRLEAMYLMAATVDMDAVRAQIAEGIDIMVHIEKIEGKRRITEITELIGYKNGQFILNSLMNMSESTGSVKATGNQIINSRKIWLRGEKNANILRQYGFIGS